MPDTRIRRGCKSHPAERAEATRAALLSPRQGPDPIVVGSARGAYHVPRRRTLDADRRHRVVVLTDQGRSLREFAAEIGVSPETVRKALADGRTVPPRADRADPAPDTDDGATTATRRRVLGR